MKKTTIKKRSRLRYVASEAAVLAVFLIASNGICHAATGHTRISKVTYYVNGEKEEVDVSFRVEGDTLIA